MSEILKLYKLIRKEVQKILFKEDGFDIDVLIYKFCGQIKGYLSGKGFYKPFVKRVSSTHKPVFNYSTYY